MLLDHTLETAGNTFLLHPIVFQNTNVLLVFILNLPYQTIHQWQHRLREKDKVPLPIWPLSESDGD